MTATHRAAYALLASMTLPELFQLRGPSEISTQAERRLRAQCKDDPEKVIEAFARIRKEVA